MIQFYSMLATQQPNKPFYNNHHCPKQDKHRLNHQKQQQDIFNLNDQLISDKKDSIDIYATCHNKNIRQFHQSFHAVGMMGPSLVFMNPQQDDEYISIKRSQKKATYRPKKHRRRKTYFDPKQNQEIDEFVNCKTARGPSFINFDIEEDDAINVPKMQISTGQGFESEDLSIQSHNREIENLDDFNHQDDLFFAEDNSRGQLKQQVSFKEQRIEESNQDVKSDTPQYEKQSILEPSLRMLESQRQLTQSFLDGQYFSGSESSFIKNAIPDGSRIIFEAFVENQNIFQRQFTFWLSGQNEKIVLMTAKKLMKLTENEYTIKQYFHQTKEFKFAAKIQNKLQNNKYLIWDYDKQNKIAQKTKKQNLFFGQINIHYNLVQNRNVLNLIYPAFDRYTNQQQKKLFKQDKSYLQQLIYGSNNQMEGLYFCKLKQAIQKKFMQEHSLVKTKKSIVMKDLRDNVKIYIGKLESKRYKIIAGAGVSPMLVFAVLIIMIES